MDVLPYLDRIERLQYDFSLEPHQLSEFAGMCQYHQPPLIPTSRATASARSPHPTVA
jgi:hypothetical protein